MKSKQEDARTQCTSARRRAGLHIASHSTFSRTRPRSKAEAKKSSIVHLKEDTALSAGTKKVEGKVEFSDDVVAGDLDSAYAAQQMTSNIVVERKKDQKRIDGLYDKSIKAPGPGKAPLPAGTRVKEVERKGEQVKGAHDGRRGGAGCPPRPSEERVIQPRVRPDESMAWVVAGHEGGGLGLVGLRCVRVACSHVVDDAGTAVPWPREHLVRRVASPPSVGPAESGTATPPTGVAYREVPASAPLTTSAVPITPVTRLLLRICRAECPPYPSGLRC